MDEFSDPVVVMAEGDLAEDDGTATQRSGVEEPTLSAELALHGLPLRAERSP
jgi:hypothetical protein